MTSFDPDTLAQDKAITRSIYQRFEGNLALNCFVIEGGRIAIGDKVELVRGQACAETAAAIEAGSRHARIICGSPGRLVTSPGPRRCTVAASTSASSTNSRTTTASTA